MTKQVIQKMSQTIPKGTLLVYTRDGKQLEKILQR
jgi:hypothetical protein